MKNEISKDNILNAQAYIETISSVIYN